MGAAAVVDGREA